MATERLAALARATLAGLAVVVCSVPASAQRVEELRSTWALPPHIAGRFEEPASFQQTASGEYLVFDRGTHAVYVVDAEARTVRAIVEIGREAGRIIAPSAMSVGPAGTFAVADAPNLRERVQLFWPDGSRIGGFTLPGRAAPRLRINGVALNGVGSLQHLGESLLINLPETGALVTEYRLSGRAIRSFGGLRQTGYESDRDVHLALNSGVPLADPTGGFYFVFQAGVPVFRKYDGMGRLVFERHIEGREVDPLIRSLPTTWNREAVDSRQELPVVPISVRAAAVDAGGRLWIALSTAYTYVYDPQGEKTRTLRLRAAGLIRPTGLAFARDGRLLVTPGCYAFTVP